MCARMHKCLPLSVFHSLNCLSFLLSRAEVAEPVAPPSVFGLSEFHKAGLLSDRRPTRSSYLGDKNVNNVM